MTNFWKNTIIYNEKDNPYNGKPIAYHAMCSVFKNDEQSMKQINLNNQGKNSGIYLFGGRYQDG